MTYLALSWLINDSWGRCGESKLGQYWYHTCPVSLGSEFLPTRGSRANKMEIHLEAICLSPSLPVNYDLHHGRLETCFMVSVNYSWGPKVLQFCAFLWRHFFLDFFGPYCNLWHTRCQVAVHAMAVCTWLCSVMVCKCVVEYFYSCAVLLSQTNLQLNWSFSWSYFNSI